MYQRTKSAAYLFQKALGSVEGPELGIGRIRTDESSLSWCIFFNICICKSQYGL